jgi:hypothetical protein
MNLLKKVTLSIFVITLFSTITVNAQTEGEKDSVRTSETGILENPRSDQQKQEQRDDQSSPGTSSYSIEDSIPEAKPQEVSWKSEAEGEELKLYSGSHDGNNYVKTITVKSPANGSSTYTTEYKPN